MNAALVWFLQSEHAGEASCATGVTCGSGVPFLPAWRHLGDRNDVTSWRSGPPQCDIVAVGGAVTGAAGSRQEGAQGPARREGCARSRRPPPCARRPATHSEGATPTRHPCREALVRVVAQWA
jgi:hypothetical protein